MRRPLAQESQSQFTKPKGRGTVTCQPATQPQLKSHIWQQRLWGCSQHTARTYQHHSVSSGDNAPAPWYPQPNSSKNDRSISSNKLHDPSGGPRTSLRQSQICGPYPPINKPTTSLSECTKLTGADPAMTATDECHYQQPLGDRWNKEILEPKFDSTTGTHIPSEYQIDIRFRLRWSLVQLITLEQITADHALSTTSTD